LTKISFSGFIKNSIFFEKDGIYYFILNCEFLVLSNETNSKGIVL